LKSSLEFRYNKETIKGWCTVRKVDVSQLEEGMILGAPIVDTEGVVELLSRGTKLTKRHIALINQMGSIDIFILDYEDEEFEEVDMNVEDLAKKAEADGK